MSWAARHLCNGCKVQRSVWKHGSSWRCDMERRPPVGFAGKLQASKDAVQCNIIEFVLDCRQFVRKRGACHQRDPFSDCLVFKERVENTGVSVVSWSTKKNLFAMTIVKAKFHRRCKLLVSDVIIRGPLQKGKERKKRVYNCGSLPFIFSSAHSLPHPASIKSHKGWTVLNPRTNSSNNAESGISSLYFLLNPLKFAYTRITTWTFVGTDGYLVLISSVIAFLRRPAALLPPARPSLANSSWN